MSLDDRIAQMRAASRNAPSLAIRRHRESALSKLVREWRKTNTLRAVV